MARPRKPKKTRRVTVRLPDREAKLLEDLAEQNDRTISAEFLRALRHHFQDQGLLGDDRKPPPAAGGQ